jgi:hypothetical protein
VPYLISALAVAAGAVVLMALLVRLACSTRGLARTTRSSGARLADRRGPLTARIAALQVELAKQRRARNEEGSGA